MLSIPFVLVIHLTLLANNVLGTARNQPGEFTCNYNYTLFYEMCYRLHSIPKTNYDEAQRICRIDNAELASIHELFTNTFLQNFNIPGFLIGLRYYETENVYKWSDGTPVDFTNYATDFEQNRDYYGYCTKSVNGKWTNAECDDDELEFMCAKRATRIVPTVSRVCPNATVHTTPEMVLSPGYPQNYEFPSDIASEGCYYTFLAKNDYLIKITFEEISLIGDGGTIDVYKGFDATPENKIISCDNSFAGGRLTVNYNRVLLHLVNSVQGRWKVSWITVKKDEDVSASYNECPDASALYTTPGLIYSPGYPQQFNLPTDISSAGCTYMIAGGEEDVILKLDEVDLDYNNGWVEVYRGWELRQENRINRLNNNNKGQEVFTGSNKALVRLVDVTRGTFVLSWSRGETCKPGWIFFQGSCYYSSIEKKKQADAAKWCTAEDAYLVSVLSVEEQQFLNTNFDHTTYYWIGLMRQSGIWKWLDGSEFIYNNWSEGQPDNINLFMHCAVANYRTVGTWGNLFCEEAYRFICKQKK